MEEDQNYLKINMKKIFIIILFCTIPKFTFAENFNLKRIVGLENPWGSSFINESELIVTEKEGKIKIVNINSNKISEIKHNLNFLVDGQGGLLDILFKEDSIYISYSEDRGDRKSSTSIAKANFNKKELDYKNVFQAEPPINTGYHFG